jgi:hypothetical protein
MIRRLRAWWRRIDEHWRKKRELLLAADKAYQDLGYGVQTFEEIELYLLQLGVLHLESAVYGRSVAQKAMEAGIREGVGDVLSHTVH